MGRHCGSKPLPRKNHARQREWQKREAIRAREDREARAQSNPQRAPGRDREDRERQRGEQQCLHPGDRCPRQMPFERDKYPGQKRGPCALRPQVKREAIRQPRREAEQRPAERIRPYKIRNMEKVAHRQNPRPQRRGGTCGRMTGDKGKLVPFSKVARIRLVNPRVVERKAKEAARITCAEIEEDGGEAEGNKKQGWGARGQGDAGARHGLGLISKR